ncbi:MAG: hypothetical protein AAFV69_08525 [Pseudomonadota bacterium]
MKLPTIIAYVLISGLVLAATAAKAVRYNERHTRTAISDTANVAAAFSKLGWRQRNATNAVQEENQLFPVLEFTSTSCPTPIRVSLLGQDTDLRRFVELQEAGDIVVIQNGQIQSLAAPAWAIVQPSHIWRAIKREFHNDPKLPVIAISPSSVASTNSCSLPTLGNS